MDPDASDSMMGANDTAVAVAAKPGSKSGSSSGSKSASKPGSRPGAETSLSGETAAGVAPVSSPNLAADLIGETLGGRYLVNRKVGQGGMGAVYEATHTLIGKRVAVKVLLEKYAQREAIVKRLKQEAQLASSVGNEHIIDITDFGTTEDGRTFVVMEFLEGESLAECLGREIKLDEQRILRIVSQACSALAAAHAKGVVHRDIKPENLFLLRRRDADFVKVVDFGISKSLRATDEGEETTRLTQTGMVLGTPLYMSPEQARGDDELDHRVDVYALGVIMYECAAGKVPFVGNNYLSVISQVLNEEPKALRELRPELSEEFDAVVAKAMSKDVRERYQSANEMLADITSLLDDPTRSTERAKITGPRRKSIAKRSDGSTRYVIWIAGVAVVLAAVVFSVTRLAGGGQKQGPGSGSQNMVTPPSPPADASVAPPAIDAPPAKVIQFTINTKPDGAEITCDGLPAGTTPDVVVKVVEGDNTRECMARKDGFNEYAFKLNPMLTDHLDFTFPLVKPPKGTPVKRSNPVPKDGAGSGSATVQGPHDKTGGEFSGDPYGPSGTVPKPK